MSEAIQDVRQFRKQVLVSSDVMGIVASGRSTGKIETEKTLHGIYLICRTAAGVGLTEAQIAADIGNIVIRANGIVIRELTAAQLIDMYQHYKNDMVAHVVAGVIPIEFADSAFDLRQLNNAFALGMVKDGKPVTMTYEINYAAVLAQLASIQIRMVVDDRIQEFGLHKRILTHRRTFAAAAPQDITDLPKGDGSSSLLAYHFVLGNGTITTCTVNEGSRQVYNQIPTELMDVLINDSGRKPQAGYYHLPFNLDNDVRSKQLIGPQTANWLVQPTWGVAPNGYSILEEREHTRL